MELNEARIYISNFTKTFAKEKFGVDVSVFFNNAVKRWGSCYWHEKKICYSNNYLEVNKDNIKAMEALAIHECCHLKHNNHGREFKALCMAFGVNENHIYKLDSLNIKRPEPKTFYLFKCPNCNTEYKTMRKYRVKNACYECCKKFNNNKYTEKYALQYIKYVCG